MVPLKVLFVQPIQSPYWTKRIEALAKDSTLDITLLLERDNFTHRPGWTTTTITDVNIEILGSTIFKSTNDGIRSIPFKLAFKIKKLQPDVIVLPPKYYPLYQ